MVPSDMTEKLLTGTLNLRTNKQPNICYIIKVLLDILLEFRYKVFEDNFKVKRISLKQIFFLLN